MANKCEKDMCVANLKGECILNECEGELIQIPKSRVTDREKLRMFYEITRDTFFDGFKKEGASNG